MYQRALPVAGDLDLEMAGIENEFFQQHAAVAECGFRLGARADDGSSKIGGRIDPPHAASAAAGRGLDQHGKTDPRRGGRKAVDVLRITVIAGNRRHAGGFGDAL